MTYQPTLDQFIAWLEKKHPNSWMTLKLVKHWKEKFLYGEMDDCCELCMEYSVCPKPITLCGNYRTLATSDYHSSLGKVKK